MIPYYAAQYGFAASTRDLDKEKAAKELEKPEDKTPKPAQPSCSTNPPNKKKRKWVAPCECSIVVLGTVIKKKL